MSEETNELCIDNKNGVVEKKLNEMMKEKKRLVDTLLSGKCPASLIERDGKIKWEYPVLRDGFNTICDAFKSLTATTDTEFAKSIIIQGAYATIGHDNATKYNVAMQALADSDPKDATESKFILQAHALYTQGMKYLSLAEINTTIPQIDFCLKNATKLLRLHNETIDALNKYRRGGEQRVIVQHVQVNDGGKAIVGNMIAGGGGK